APPELRPALGVEPRARFVYAAPAGEVEVTIELRENGVRAIARPYPARAAAAPAPTQARPAAPQAPAQQPAAAPAPQPARIELAADPRRAMDQLLELMLARRASDLHLTSATT